MEFPKEESPIISATARTCKSCLEANLVTEVKLARCTKCSQVFCLHFASNIDPQYCIECLSDVTLHKEVVIKTYEYEGDDGEVKQYKRRAKSIRLEGLDWLFMARKIVDLSDESLELAIEYHREYLQGLLTEREARKAKFLHRYAGVKLDTAPSGQVDSATSTETTVKKTKTISSNKAQATANAALQAMLASGKSIDDIMAMLSKGVK
jgi:hypothetical protein